jgi:hypothetical protein
MSHATNTPTDGKTNNQNASGYTTEELMKLASRPCYVGGQTRQIRGRGGDKTITMADVVNFRGDGFKSLYVERLKHRIDKGKDVDRPSVAVQYLLDFAGILVKHYAQNTLPATLKLFNADWKEHQAERRRIKNEIDAEVSEVTW